MYWFVSAHLPKLSISVSNVQHCTQRLLNSLKMQHVLQLYCMTSKELFTSPYIFRKWHNTPQRLQYTASWHADTHVRSVLAWQEVTNKCKSVCVLYLWVTVCVLDLLDLHHSCIHFFLHHCWKSGQSGVYSLLNLVFTVNILSRRTMFCNQTAVVLNISKTKWSRNMR